jgi:hydroxymethylbilane synthase
VIKPLRGNVNTRLAKLDAGEFDAVILASAGLIRLGFSDRVASFISAEDSLPAIGQGAVGIECREDDERINTLLKPLHHEETAICVRAERAMNHRLNGGCQVPIAGYAELKDGQVHMRGLVGEPDGSSILRSETRGPAAETEQLGIQVADHLLSNGADRILKALYAD